MVISALKAASVSSQSFEEFVMATVLQRDANLILQLGFCVLSVPEACARSKSYQNTKRAPAGILKSTVASDNGGEWSLGR